MKSWWDQNGGAFAGSLHWNEPLSKYTYYRIGGPADLLLFPKTRDDLVLIGRFLRETGTPAFVLGAGSNLLVSDGGFRGAVIRMGRVNLETTVLDSGHLRTGTSVAVSSFLRRASAEGWSGFEFLSGIPGSMGGVVTMNAGTHLGEACSRITRVEAISFSGERLEFAGDALKFEYRRNLFLPKDAWVWSVDWKMELGDPASVKAAIDGTLARRKATQPIDFPSCGSVFKNPPGQKAWQIIEKLGLRGHRQGDAQFSEKHPNFIVNLGSAQASDVRGLIELAQKRAHLELGVELETEVIFLG